MGLWQKLVLITLAVVGAFFGWRSLRLALASEDQKVRWVFEDLERGFNLTRMAPAIGSFAEGYVDESTGLTRDELRDVLIYLFLREHDSKTKRFSLRLEVDEDGLVVDVTGEGRAQVRGGARFFKRTGETEELFWDARFLADLADGEHGWRIVHTSQVNVAEMAELD